MVLIDGGFEFEIEVILFFGWFRVLFVLKLCKIKE